MTKSLVSVPEPVSPVSVSVFKGVMSPNILVRDMAAGFSAGDSVDLRKGTEVSMTLRLRLRQS